MSKKPTQTVQNKLEMYTEWYFDELVKFGYLESYDREPEVFMVMPSYVHKREKHYKKMENNTENFTLLNDITYTYDYRLFWTEKAKYLFFEVFDPHTHFIFGKPSFVAHLIKFGSILKTVSFVDVKPHFTAAEHGGDLSTYYTFPLIQKFLMYTRGLYINKVMPTATAKYGKTNCLFAKTFTPTRYRHTDGGTQERKIHHRKTTIGTYVGNKEAEIRPLLEKRNQATLL